MKKRFLVANLILALVLVLSLGLSACGIFGGGNGNPYTTTIDTPEVTFSDESFTLYWNEVEHAKSYEIKHNGTTTDVGKVTSKQVVLEEGENKFQVRAIGDNVLYVNSNWSTEITYHHNPTAQDKTVFEKVRDKMLSASTEMRMELVRVVGISYADNEHLTGDGGNFIFETIWKDGNKIKNVRMCYLVEAENLTEALEKFDEARLLHTQTYSTVDFNSAQMLVNSKGYAGYMAELYGQGYEISVMDSLVREGRKAGDGFRFEIVGTYKAERNGDVKYFSTVYEINSSTYSSVDKYNYEDNLRFPARREIKEYSLVIHNDAGTLAYIEEWAERR